MKIYQHPDLSDVALPAVMQALSDPCRISIVHALLKHEELACNELPVEVAKATLTHHMAVLREAGLIYTRVDGAKCLNSLRSEEFDKQFPGIISLVEQSAVVAS
ncbi:ArsR/SmtB family transcription factor [Cerasicoccus arenae]|uniref:Transcriptional regulator n=1 Tax=Cerasicoccus arenae TaxID=424488 RepID=A0A8J3GFJ2_9BACT|nr:helix-turn-helix transcriptional regulator [Cerasicoccus arenae]MBK1856653.1 helix-turn-helix transcriptional regulator [Cerasicoccus arenae]GHC12213.1 transcriptional regulator [Cerasicoccus arenae]